MATTVLAAVLGTTLVVMVTVAVLLTSRPWQSSDTLHRAARASGSSLVMLRGGLKPWEGMVVWKASDNPLCRESLTQEDADVICKSLFRDRLIEHAVFRNANGFIDRSQYTTVAIGNFGCHGYENDLDECPRPSTHAAPAFNCPRGIAVLTCEARAGVGETIQLAGGSSEGEGRLELGDNGTWQSVCNLGFDTKLSGLEAVPICKTIGLWYTTPTVARPGEFGAGSGDLVASVPQCTGDEPDVRYCSLTPLAKDNICNHTQDAGIRCTVPAMTSSAVSFLGNSNLPWRGQVRIQEPGSALTTAVCARNWDANVTTVTCRTAGYKYGGTTLNPVSSTAFSTRTRLGRLECKGQEATLAECSGYDLENSFQCGNPEHIDLAAVDCSAGYRVRLSSADHQKAQGVLEIFKPESNEWITIKNGSLDLLGAKAACSSLQYPDTNPGLYGDVFGSNNTANSLDCSAGQEHIAQCVIPASSVKASTHAAVRCFQCGTVQPAAGESGDLVVLSNMANSGRDCMYVIRPSGPAPLYKLWVDDMTLLNGDMIDIRESPELGPVEIAVGPSTAGPFLVFDNELYIRVKAVNRTGHSATIHWRPITVETVTSLTCTDDDMKIRVNVTELGWLYNDTDPNYISLVNEGCTGSASGDTWMIDNPHSQCYTQRSVDEDFVHYRNALIYKEKGAGPIVREHRWRVDLECHFRRQRTVDTQYVVTDVYNYQMNLNSDYEATIHLYNDSSLKTELTGAQVRARLGDDLYVRVTLAGEWNVTMHLQDCVARPTADSTTSYNLIENGCASDSETFIVYSSHNSTLFHFKAFEFYSGFSTVYVFCDVIYCAPMDTDPKCNRDC